MIVYCTSSTLYLYWGQRHSLHLSVAFLVHVLLISIKQILLRLTISLPQTFLRRLIL